ncbi:MAG: hypothetical protein ABIP51_05240, partial [Bacteroidia bacterium]
MKNPEHNNNLDHLFNKAKADQQDLDDFEKEALAGFEMLGSEKEAKDLKASLDTRIQKELFEKEEKRNPKVYWLAAAGLFLVIGLSTLFITNNTDSVSKQSNLAISNIDENKKEILPESAEKLKEELTPPKEVVTSVVDQEAPKTEIDGKEKVAKTGALKELEQSENKQENKEPAKGITSRMIPTMPITKGPTDVDKEVADRRKADDKSGDGINYKNDQNIELDDLSKNSGAKTKEADVFKAQTAVRLEQTVNIAESESTSSKDLAATKSAKEKSKKDEKSVDETAKTNSNESIAANNSNGYAFEKREENRANKKGKKSAETQNTAGIANPSYDNTPGTPNSTTTGATGEANNVPADAKKYESGFTNCYYSGGEVAITKDLKEKL